MKIKISNAITAALCAAVLSAASYSLGYADTDTGGGTGYSSQGKIVFDNGTEDTADDVIFDASDFRLIDDMVTEGKTNIKNELNQYGNIQIDDDIPEFGTLAASVSAISDGTDAAAGNILSGKKALVGKNIVTGSMADHSGTSTSTSQIKENGTTAEITIPGGYYDENSKITIPIDVIKDLPAINSNLARRIEIPIKLTAVMIPASSSNPSQQRSTDITIVIENGKATVTGTPSTGVGIDSYGTANASVTVGKPVIDK